MKYLTLIVALMLTGCTASDQVIGPKSIDTTNTALTTTIVDSGEAGSLTSHAQQGQHFTSFGVEGMEVFSPSPAGGYYIGQSGAAVSDPKDTAIGEITMDFAVFTDPDTGKPVVYTKKVHAVGINQDISGPIAAQAHQWEAWVESLRELQITEREKFDALMETIQATAPDLFDLISAALGGIG